MDSSKRRSSEPDADAAPTADPGAPSPGTPFGGSPAREEIEAAIRKYYQLLGASNYEELVTLMGPGMQVFTPYGTLMHLPTDMDAVVAIYKQLQAQGFHMSYTPFQIDGMVFGNVAFGAYLLQGSETSPGGSTTNATRRGTQVWVKDENGQWRIAHMHVSTSDEWESWRGKLPPK